MKDWISSMKTDKNKNHLSEEILIGSIEGNLSDPEAESVTNHLESCDSCFIRYSTLHSSYKEMRDVELEVTPDMLKERANKYFHLGEPWVKSFLEKLRIFVDQIGSGLKQILQPRPVVYALVTAGLVILVFYTVKGPEQEPYFAEETKPPSIDLAEKFPQTEMAPVASTGMSGISVKLSKKFLMRGLSSYNMYSLVVTQPFRFNRNLTVQTLDGEDVLSKEFQSMTSNFDFPLSTEHDSIYVKITTLDSVVYEDLLDVEQDLTEPE
jgi:hypothetical protein